MPHEVATQTSPRGERRKQTETGQPISTLLSALMPAVRNNLRGRFWCFTLNNPTSDEEAELRGLRNGGICSYIVFGREKGAGGTPHLQGYVEWHSRPRFSQVIKMVPGRCHIERREGTAKQAADYCKKGEQSHDEWCRSGAGGPTWGLNADVFEAGKISLESGGAGKRTDLDEVREWVRSGEVANEKDLAEQVRVIPQWTFGRAYLALRGAPVRPKPFVAWFHGPSGCGKSREMHRFASEMGRRGFSSWSSLCDPELKWFDGYRGDQIALFDDYRFDISKCSFNKVLNVLDRYPLRVQVKGSSTWFSPRFIIVTSNAPPGDVFRSAVDAGEDLYQIERRLSGVFDFGRDGLNEFRSSIVQYLASPAEEDSGESALSPDVDAPGGAAVAGPNE